VKMKRYLVFPIMFSYFFINGLYATSARAEDLTPMLDKISKRMNSYPGNNNWKYGIVTKSIETNEQWQPKKTTISKAIIKVVDSMVSGELLEAVEIENGNSKDISQKIATQLKEQMESANKETAKRKGQKGIENALDIFFPFNDNKRAKFEFRLLNGADINERPVLIIEALAKEKDARLFEGKYYIDEETYDVLKAQITPSKNPKFVKDMYMDIDFEVLPEGNFIRRRSKTRVNGSFLFKRTWIIFEEEYFDVKILN